VYVYVYIINLSSPKRSCPFGPRDLRGGKKEKTPKLLLMTNEIVLSPNKYIERLLVLFVHAKYYSRFPNLRKKTLRIPSYIF